MLVNIYLHVMSGKNNIAAGLLFMALFMAYGFLLIYLRDFATDKAQWIAQYGSGKHFEVRLAHVHGNLFALLNVLIGFLLVHFHDRIARAGLVSWLGITGMLMPLGILAEVYLDAPPVFVLIGAIAMTMAVFLLGISFYNLKKQASQTP